MTEHWGKFCGVLNTIEYIIIAALLYKVARWNLKFFVTYMLARVLPLSADLKKSGSWAVVTGCTDGIGKAFAEQLAAKGLNVVLISRTLSKLEDLAAEIESHYKVKTLVIAANFIKDDIYDDIKLRMAHLDIGVLINNVGVASDHPEYFAEIEDPNFVEKMINTNIMSVAKMTQIVLPGMSKRACGYIVNIASAAGLLPFPFISLYSSTKRFIVHFTQCMDLEYMERGITFQCLSPFFVVSKMSRYSKPSISIPSATVYVKSALKTIGLQKFTTGYWSHELQKLFVPLMPTFTARKYLLYTRNVAREQLAKGIPSNEIFYWF